MDIISQLGSSCNCDEIKQKQDTISTDQYNEILRLLDDRPKHAQEIKDAHGIKTLADLTKDQYQHVKKEVMRIRKLEEEYERESLR